MSHLYSIDNPLPMSSDDAPVNVASLLATFNLEIRALPDKLKCTECKLVLKDACQVSCGCRFCRACIDGLMARESQFCPGGSRECGRTPLSTALRDYRANKSIMKLTAKCLHEGCTHECTLADMEDHLQVCSRESVVAGIKRNMEMLKEENQSIREENESMKNEIRSNKLMVAKINGDMEMLKQELEMKDEQGRHLENELKSIKDENQSMKNEIRSVKIENESIKREKEVLSERVRELAENLDREIEERRQSDERASAGISAVTVAVASNRDALGTEMEPVRGDIRSIIEQLDFIRCQMESMHVAVGLVQLTDWLIDADVGKTAWIQKEDIKTSGKFRGGGRPHTYELASWNSVSWGELGIWLRIWAGPSDAQLQWPFRGAVTITVAHKDNAEKCVRRTGQCQIERPPDNRYSDSASFKFPHATLRRAGLDLECGVCVSCQIMPGAGQ